MKWLKMNDECFDFLKRVQRYLLPALGTLYFALCGIWGWGYGEEIVGTITAVDTFLAVVLAVASKNYNELVAEEEELTEEECFE